MSRPAIRNAGASNWPSASRSSAQPARRFLEGLLASSRYGKNQAERVLALAAAYPRQDVSGGTGAGRALRRLLPGGRAANPRSTEPAQDTAGCAGRRPSVLPGRAAR